MRPASRDTRTLLGGGVFRTWDGWCLRGFGGNGMRPGPQPGRWVRGRVDGLELRDGDVDVELRRGELGVPDHLLHEAHVRSPFQHHRHHGVAEQMARPAFAQL